MKVGTLCSGIGGGDLGLERAGHTVVWQAEIEPYCRRVLKNHWPEVPNVGNIEELDGRRLEPVDIICAGTPCQDLSVAGRRAGLAGARSSLFFEAARVINECRPAFVIWENVPGAFSSDAGRDLWMVLYTFRELGANDLAWRVFDSRYAGVPQQRRRIYLVADFRGRRAGEILFDPEGCGGHPAPFSEEGEALAGALTSRARGAGGKLSGRGGEDDYNLTSKPLGSNATGGFRFDLDHDTYVVKRRGGYGWTEREDGVSPTLESQGGLHQGGAENTPLTLIQDVRGGAHKRQNGAGISPDPSAVAYTLDAVSQPAVMVQNSRSEVRTMEQPGAQQQHYVFQERSVSENLENGPGGKGWKNDGAAYTLEARNKSQIVTGTAIRRFTPLECERLQGFPDFWTCLCGATDMFACKCPDGPRYRALGNAMTTTTPEAIGRRM